MDIITCWRYRRAGVLDYVPHPPAQKPREIIKLGDGRMKIFKITFLILGLALLGWVLKNTDLTEILNLLGEIGIGFLVILGIYFFAFLFDSLTWQLTVLSIPLTPKWLYHFFQMRLAGEAFNNILPAGSLGGEPIKAVLLKNLYGINYRDGVASLILARTINTVALILFLFIGFYLMVHTAILEEEYTTTAGIGLLTLTVLIFLFFSIQRFKIASQISETLSKKRGFQWLGGILHQIKDIDGILVKFYKNHQGRAAYAFALAFVNWVLGVGEIIITMHFLGHPITLTDAWIIEAAAQLVRAATFFIPASIGAQEGAFLVIGSAVTGSPSLGITMAIVRRAREIIWVAWGIVAFYTTKKDNVLAKEN
jgi:uncharacterized protein (TIRG00374 family)